MVFLMRIYIFVLSIFTTFGQEILEAPRSVAAHIGSRTSIQCKVDIQSDIIEWRYYGKEVTGERIWVSSNPGDIIDPRFQAEIDEDLYRLVIPNLSEDLIGTYACRLIIKGADGTAEILAITPVDCEPKPSPPPDSSPPEVPEDAEMNFRCTTTVKGKQQPNVQWYRGDKEILTTHSVDPETNEITAYGTVSATADLDEEVFTCRVMFPEDDGPVYTDNCTSFYQVIHAVTNIITYPDPDHYENQIVPVKVGEQFNCSASGRPEPTYSWYNKDTFEERVGAVFEITEDLTGQHTWACRAQNLVMGNPRSVEREVTFLAEGFVTDPPTDPDSPVKGAKAQGWVIAVAIVIPLVFLIIIIIIGVCIMKKRRSKNKEDKVDDPAVNEPLKPKPKPRPPKNDSEDGRIYKPKSQSSMPDEPLGPYTPPHGGSYRYAPPEALHNAAPNGNTHNPQPLTGYGMMGNPEPMRRSNRSLNKSKQSLNRSLEALDRPPMNRSTASLDRSIDEYGNPIPQPRPKPQKKAPPPTKPKPQMHQNLGVRVLPTAPGPSPARQQSLDTAV